MNRNSNSRIQINSNLAVLISVYSLFSIPIFLLVYNASRLVIDEEFHIRQAKEYCDGNFYVWDPKITTFPGLYILANIIIPREYCTTFFLRLVVLFASIFNVILMYKIQQIKLNSEKYLILSTLSVSILPPMYFFAHIFYTDIVSLTTVLGLYYYWLISQHKVASCWGIAAVFMRQTNIIWVIMVLGSSVIDELFNVCKNNLPRKLMNNNLKALLHCLKYVLSNSGLLHKFVKKILSNFWMYIQILIGFAIFLIYNKSIVLGDRTAHTASLHIPQIFYFSLYVLCFGSTIIMPHLKSTIHLVLKNKIKFLLMTMLFTIIIQFNTIQHPYLLADNRHYIFYIWHRLYIKYDCFRYVIAPIYLFAIILIMNSLKNSNNFSYNFMFCVSTFIVLALQSLIEIRYFMIPFILLRITVKTINRHLIMLDLLYYIVINFGFFYIFSTKEIYWADYKEVQRLIW